MDSRCANLVSMVLVRFRPIPEIRISFGIRFLPSGIAHSGLLSMTPHG